MLKIFEQKNNTVAFVAVSIAAILYGSFGLISAQAQITKTPPLLFITLGIFFGLITSTVVGLLFNSNNFSVLKLVFSKNKNLSVLEKSNISSFRKMTLLRSFAGLYFVFTMAGFYLLDNKIIGVLIAETYPIFSILISYYLLKKVLKRGNLLYDWLLIIISLLGVFLLFWKEIYILENNTAQLWGIALSLIGALLVAYATVLSPIMTIQLSKIRKKSNFNNSITSQFITDLLLFCVMFVVSVAFYTLDDFKNLLNQSVLLNALLLGASIVFLSNVLSRTGGAIATSHNIFLVWFLTPVVGVILLWYFGFGEIDSTIVLAFILILVPNILLNLDIKESFSFKATFIWILLSTIILFYYEGGGVFVVI